ncbi:NAD(P)-dependent oxidoreductase [Granulosicoccaceae sp. 1_MG-2023]|nr:NAD(P)-dependent oxidoreductase [Granulosicoccaceae sp. 1_MG-2023]
MPEQPRLAFIGIGLMGAPMTRKLLQAGYTVTIWNRSEHKCRPLTGAGAQAADSAAAAAGQADVVFLSLTDTAAVEQVVFGPGGIASVAGEGKILIDTSSIDPAASADFAARLQAANGMQWVDAPVSGGVVGAQNASLSFMLGGDPGVCGQIRPLLSVLGARITYMGPHGAGQTTKVFNQMIVGCNAVVIAEMMAAAKRAGLDAAKIPEALSGGFADSKPLQLMGPRMASDNFEPVQWTVATLLKDLGNAVALADRLGQNVPVTEFARSLMQQHGEQHAAADLSSLVKLFEK